MISTDTKYINLFYMDIIDAQLEQISPTKSSSGCSSPQIGQILISKSSI
jgi:hypothetical protein